MSTRSMSCLVGVAVWCGGCGSFGFTPEGGGPGANEPGTPPGGSGAGAAAGAAACGDATLLERARYDDYEAATFSFEHASVADSDAVRNDWDLQFGNDPAPGIDLFSVNMVVDDRSFIVDLGPGTLADVPEVVDPAAYAVGYWEEHDNIPAVLGHVYFVRTFDDDTRQVAAFRVEALVPDDDVTIRWLRSSDPDRFVAPDDPTCAY